MTQLKVLRATKLMEARYRDLLESTPDGIVMVNPTGHVEQELQRKNVELANANESKDGFLAGMSHELRTPLNAMQYRSTDRLHRHAVGLALSVSASEAFALQTDPARLC